LWLADPVSRTEFTVKAGQACDDYLPLQKQNPAQQ
jgi:hypothetical protein